MKKTFLVPEYFLNFNCIGPNCEDTCCKGWNIYIDEDTYKKYSAISSSKTDIGIKFKNSIKKINHTNTRNYAQFKLDNKGNCKFLSENLLCEIHSKLGGSFLCDTCKYYPRMYSTLNEYAEAHLTLSCPEAARQALLNENGISFYEQEISFFEKLPKSTHSINFDNSLLEYYFFDIRIFTIKLLQNRNYSIEERLGILGIVFDYLETHKDSNINIVEVLNSYQINIDNDIYKDLFKPLKYDDIKDIQLKYLIIAQKNIIKKIVKSNRPYFIEFEKFLEGSKLSSNSDINDIFQTYQYNTENYYVDFLNKYDYILENYLVDLVFKSKFPLNDSTTPLDSYLNLIVHFSIVRTEIIGLLGYYKTDLDLNGIIYLIQGITTMINHNSEFHENMIKSFIDNGINNIPALMLLFCY